MSLPYTVIPKDETKPAAAFQYPSDAIIYAAGRGPGTRIKARGLVALKVRDAQHASALYNFIDNGVDELVAGIQDAIAKRNKRYASYAAKGALLAVAATFATTEN